MFSYFRFPFREPELVIKWVLAVRRKNWWPTQYSCICSDHFTDDDYSNKEKSILKKDAVPSIFDFSPPKRKRRKQKNQSENSKMKKLKPVQDSADGNSSSVSSEPVVIFLSDVHCDSTNDASLDTKQMSKKYILNESDMIDLMLNAPSQGSNSDTSNDCIENNNQQMKRTASTIKVTDRDLNSFITDACSNSMSSLPGSPAEQTTLPNDITDSVLNSDDDISIPGTSRNFVKDTQVCLQQSGKRKKSKSLLKRNKSDSTLNSVCGNSISCVSDNTKRDISVPLTHSLQRTAVEKTTSSRFKSIYEITDSNGSSDTTDEVPLLINISGVCNMPKSDVSVSVKQLTVKSITTEKHAADLQLNPCDNSLSTERSSRLNSVNDMSLSSNSNNSLSYVPLIITISGICIKDFNAMKDVSVSVKQLIEETDSVQNKQSAFKLKSVHDRIISDYGSDTMTDDSR